MLFPAPLAASEFLTYTYSPRLARRLDTNAVNDQVTYNHEPPVSLDCSYVHPSGVDPGTGTITYGFQAASGQTIGNMIASQSGALFTQGTILGEFSTNNGASFSPFFKTDPYQSEPTNTSTRANLRALNSTTVLIRYTLVTNDGDNSQVQFCRDCNDAPASLRFDFDVPVSLIDLPRKVHISSSPGGTVTIQPAGVSYPKYSPVTLTAKTNAGYAFSGWFGDVVSFENPLTVTLDDSKSLTAHFESVGDLGQCISSLTNLARWWPGDGNLIDVITGKAAIAGGAVSYRAGHVGLGLSFDGVVDFLVVTGPSLNWPWTVAAWVNRQDSLQNSAALMSSDASAIKIEQVQSARKVGLTRYGVADWSFNYSIPTNRWTHLALVAVAGSTRLYVDGQLEDILPNNIVLPLNRIGIGKDAGADLFKGVLDELMVFPRALTTEEVGALFDAGKAGLCKPPRLLGASRQNGAVAIHVLGSVGQQLIFGRSIDLFVWRPYSTNINTTGLFDFLVPTSRPSAFFRVAGGD